MQSFAQTSNYNSHLFKEGVPTVALHRVPHEVNSLLAGLEDMKRTDRKKPTSEPFAWLPSKTI